MTLFFRPNVPADPIGKVKNGLILNIVIPFSRWMPSGTGLSNVGSHITKTNEAWQEFSSSFFALFQCRPFFFKEKYHSKQINCYSINLVFISPHSHHSSGPRKLFFFSMASLSEKWRDVVIAGSLSWHNNSDMKHACLCALGSRSISF